MSSFVGLAFAEGESDHDVINAFFKVASGLDLRFKFLEPYAWFEVGTAKYLRFRTDCPKLDQMAVLFQDAGRGFVYPKGPDYLVKTGGSEGKIQASLMQATKLPGYNRRYRGTALKFWSRQFS